MNITESDFSNLWISIIITNTSTLLPFFFINMVDFKNIHSGKEKDDKHNLNNPDSKDYGTFEIEDSE